MSDHVHALIAQNNQAIDTITATNIKPSQAIRRGAVSRVGNGRINVTGAYTGNDDAVIDVEIVAGATNRVTKPGYVGVGTGEMDSVALLPAATPQLWNVTLVDLGIDTESASTEIEGAQIQAKLTGSAGNSISIDVDQSGIVFTETEFSLIEDVSAGTATTSGSQYDWQTVIGVGDAVPIGAQRFAFQGDSTIYLQWKVYIDGAFEYRYAPALKRDYAAGTKILFVSGSRNVTVTNGVTPEIYNNIVTLSDLLIAIRDTPSALVEVVGVIPTDRTTNVSTLDLRTRTDARIENTSGSGANAKGFIDTTVGANANTEIIQADCYAATSRDGASLGREKWRLTGSVSGDLGVMRSGDTFTEFEGRFGLKIPRVLPTGYELGETRGGIGLKFQPTGRTENEVEPSVGARPLLLGSEARDKQITFRYEKRPGDDLDWTKQIASGYISQECLGVEVDNVNINPDYLSRMQTVMTARETFMRNATRFGSQVGGSETTTLYYINFDIEVGAGGVSGGSVNSRIRTGFLSQAAADALVPNIDGEIVNLTHNLYVGYLSPMNIDGNDYQVEIRQPGTLMLTNAGGSNIADQIPYVEGLPVFTAFPLATATTGVISNVSVTPLVVNSTSGSSVTGANSTGYVADSIDIDFYSKAVRIMVSCLGDVFEDAAALGEWDTLWAEVSAELITNLDPANNQLTEGEPHDDYLIRWEAATDNIRLSAGILPKFSANAGGSDSCWRDDPSATHWWVDEEGKYLPAFTNQTYVSAVIGQNDIPETTKEFAMAILVDGNLKVGDEVRITIGDAGWESTYQVGDQLFLTTVAASPLQLAGGVDGTDTLTWSVQGDAKTADYLQTDTPAVYDNGEIQFKIENGGTPFVLGDRFTFSVENAAFRWRKDSDPFSADLPIQTTAISDGLSVEFTEGVTPSFVLDDTASFNILQTHSTNNAIVSTESRFRWETGTTITIACAGLVDTIAIALHDLTQDIQVSDGTNNYTMTPKPGAFVIDITEVTSPAITLTISEGGSIGWLFAGVPTRLFGHSDNNRMLKRWASLEGQGLNPTSSLRGSGQGWNMRFNLQMLYSDIVLLAAAIDSHKQQGNIPAIIIPHCDRDFADTVLLPSQVDVDSYSDWSSIGDIVSAEFQLLPYYE